MFTVTRRASKPGVYHIPSSHVRVRGVYTNTVPVDAYHPKRALACDRERSRSRVSRT